MSSPSAYQQVTFNRKQLIDRIKNLNQNDWMKACTRLGLYVLPARGKGSHCAVYKDALCSPDDRSCCVVTIPNHIYPNFQRDLLKKILFHGIESGKYDEDSVWKALKMI